MAEIYSASNPVIPKDEISRHNDAKKNKIEKNFEAILEKEKSAQKIKNVAKSHIAEKSEAAKKNGMNLALKKQLREFSQEFERHMWSSMWEFAYNSVKEKDGKDIIGTLYNGQYISSMVKQAYGDDMGPIAEAIYEKLTVDYMGEAPLRNDGKKYDKKL